MCNMTMDTMKLNLTQVHLQAASIFIDFVIGESGIKQTAVKNAAHEIILLNYLSPRLFYNRKNRGFFIIKNEKPNESYKPPRLQKGDVIGIVAPSSSPRDLTLFENGIRYIENALS